MVFWGVEYAASFLEVVICFYFCGSFISENSVEEKRTQVMVVSILSAFILIGLNSINMFSHISSLLFLVICTLFLCCTVFCINTYICSTFIGNRFFYGIFNDIFITYKNGLFIE